MLIYTDPTGKHEVCAVQAVQLSNGQVAVVLRCCDDPTTDHPHTVGNLHLQADGEPDEVHARVIKKLQHVAETTVAPQHAAMQHVHEFLGKINISRRPSDSSTQKSTMAIVDPEIK